MVHIARQEMHVRVHTRDIQVPPERVERLYMYMHGNPNPNRPSSASSGVETYLSTCGAHVHVYGTLTLTDHPLRPRGSRASPDTPVVMRSVARRIYVSSEQGQGQVRSEEGKVRTRTGQNKDKDEVRHKDKHRSGTYA